MKSAFLVILLSVIVSSANAAYINGPKLPACVDSDGNRVQLLEENSDVPSPAYSTIRGGVPLIIFNDALLGTIPDTRSFIGFVYLHECGHHALGHILHPSHSVAEGKKEELEADCYAARVMRKIDDKHKNFLDIRQVIQEVDTWPKDPGHPAGSRRADVIAQCYQRG